MEDKKLRQIAQIYGTEREPNPMAGRVYDAEGISPCLDTCEGGNRMPKVGITPKSCASRKRDDGHHLEHREDNLSNALTSINTDNLVDEGFRIRKLTPKECFRLQGFPDDYYERAAEVNSDSQLYKQAGNSVTVNVIYEIARRLRI